MLTYSDGNVTAGFLQQNPDIPYPPPSDDAFYLADTNGSFAISPSPALITANDTVDIAVYSNFDDAQTWSILALTSFYTTRAFAAICCIFTCTSLTNCSFLARQIKVALPDMAHRLLRAASAVVTGFSIVGLPSNVVKNVLTLTSAVQWTDPSVNDVGYLNETGERAS